MTRLRPRLGALVALAAIAAAVAAGSALAAPRGGVKLALVAYSTPKAAYAQLIPAFQATAQGQGVSFSQSFGASGDQARAVVNGQSADIVQFSAEPDMKVVADSGLVSQTWKRDLPNNGIVTNSVIVFIVRDGNPKHIKGWNDLTRSGVQVVVPNPFTSGTGRWAVVSAYGAQIKTGKKPAEGVAYLERLYKNVVSQDSSASNALNTFLSGKGDVLLSLENEAILAQQQKKPVFYVIPRATAKVDIDLAVTKSAPAQAKTFANWLFGDAAQTIWAQQGYRPISQRVAAKFAKQFPVRPGQFDIDFVASHLPVVKKQWPNLGWNAVNVIFFNPNGSVMSRIEQEVGGSTG
jgi:sulfate/thiosulfate-binding protein